MSVIFWSAAELANVAAVAYPGADDYSRRCFESACRGLAKVSQANAEEFVATYAQCHGTPVPHTAAEIMLERPRVLNRGQALATVRLLAYNAYATTPELRAEALEVIVSLLVAFLPEKVGAAV